MEITYLGERWGKTLNSGMAIFKAHDWAIESKPPVEFSDLAKALSVRCKELARQDGLFFPLQVTCRQETVLRHVAMFTFKCIKPVIAEQKGIPIDSDDDRITRLKRIFEQAVAETNEKQAH